MMNVKDDEPAAVLVPGPFQPSSVNGIVLDVQHSPSDSYDTMANKKHQKKKSKGSHKPAVAPLTTDNTSAPHVRSL